jgi:hypothetical protein
MVATHLRSSRLRTIQPARLLHAVSPILRAACLCALAACLFHKPAAAEPADPEIRSIVSAIRAERIEATIRKLVSFGTRNTLSSQDDPKRGIGAARDWILSEFNSLVPASGGRLSVELQSYEQQPGSRIPRPTKLTNIVATLHGESPERVLVVSGHYDSICSDPTDAIHDAPGANDDASGAAAVIEMARVMSAHKFRATIVFVCVAGEEQGLYGSTHFAETAKAAGMPIEAMFTNDIIGGTLGGNGVHDDRSVRVFSEGIPSDETEAQARTRRSVGGENDGPSRQLARYIKETAGQYVAGMKVTQVYRRDRYLRGGDHIPFLERGYPAVRFTEPNEDYHHQHQNVRVENGVQYGDLLQLVDFPYVARVACVNAAAHASLALAPAPPTGSVIVTSRLTNDTDLRWAASEDTQTTGYEVVWRTTTEPDWSHTKSIGKLTTYTFPGLSKDNYLFGVRAVDAKGHRSPVVYPRPGR